MLCGIGIVRRLAGCVMVVSGTEYARSTTSRDVQFVWTPLTFKYRTTRQLTTCDGTVVVR